MSLREAYEKAKQHKLQILITIVFVVGLVLIAICLYLVFIYPENQVSQLGITNVTEKANLVNQTRTTSISFIALFAQIFGGVAVGVGIYFAWGNLKVAQATLESNQKDAEKKLEVAQEGQITERFTRAVDQLGNEKLEIRLGGIYALERISNESEKDYWPIMEILTAYIRKNSNAENVATKKVIHLDMDIQANESIKSEVIEVRKISLDIQAILTVLGKRQHSVNYGDSNHLNLRATCLQGADLVKAHLEGADLIMAHFEGADLNDAHLEGAYLNEACLRGAMNLHKAHFEGAILMNVNLAGAHLSNLENAIFIKANLKGASLFMAHLERAILTEANLEGAHLYEAHLEGANLDKANLKKANLRKANLEGAVLIEAYLEEADLDKTNLEGVVFIKANLKGAKFLTIDQLSKVKTLYDAKIDEELLIPLKEKFPELFEKPDSIIVAKSGYTIFF